MTTPPPEAEELELREVLYGKLAEYKVIGDTTFGLGYKEAYELVDAILHIFSQQKAAAAGEACNRPDKNTWKWIGAFTSECPCEACVEIRKQVKRVTSLQGCSDE